MRRSSIPEVRGGRYSRTIDVSARPAGRRCGRPKSSMRLDRTNRPLAAIDPEAPSSSAGRHPRSEGMSLDTLAMARPSGSKTGVVRSESARPLLSKIRQGMIRRSPPWARRRRANAFDRMGRGISRARCSYGKSMWASTARTRSPSAPFSIGSGSAVPATAAFRRAVPTPISETLPSERLRHVRSRRLPLAEPFGLAIVLDGKATHRTPQTSILYFFSR